jgi:2-polyprenyl-3-methyl-5-hydroxy-6-metoxy-1,4-benzoquinol methylase
MYHVSGMMDERKLEARLVNLFELKHQSASQRGWSIRLRRRFGYFTPDEYYEGVVDSLIDRNTEWLDVGGGSAVFPGNPKLARILADRCKRLVAVDPSCNINENPFAHERHQTILEQFDSGSRQFPIVTARMVVEHVAHPEQFVAKLSEVVKPGGKAVVYTVSRWSPMTILSGCTPISVHHFAKRLLWGVDEKDTFDVTYLMNTRSRLLQLFEGCGFREIHFRRLDDCRTLAKWKASFFAELVAWKSLRSLGFSYPEACLLGVYERNTTAPVNTAEAPATTAG